jgi:hypothetical protein
LVTPAIGIGALLLTSEPQIASTDLDSFAAFAGRVLGIADKCGTADRETLAGTAEAVFDVINDLSNDTEAIARATERFAVNVALGAAAVEADTVRCADAQAMYLRLEHRIRRF